VVMKKPTQLPVAPLGLLSLPVSFNPTQMSNSTALILITAEVDGVSLCWQYPVQGIAEAPRSGKSFKFTCKAREALEEVLEIVPNNLGELTKTENFTHDVVYPPEHAALLEHSLRFVPLQSEIAPGGEKTGQPLRFKILFEPLRPVETSVEFLLMKSSGGRWRYTILLEAQEPVVDDVIEIEAPLGQGKAVTFRLQNPLPGRPHFRAFFTPDSPTEFSVFPSEGELENADEPGPDGVGGTPFLISYAPREYGKKLVGRLVILTDEMQWTYEVRGLHPHYDPPVAGVPKVDTRLSLEVASQLEQTRDRRHNYVKENMLAAARRPK